MSVHLGGWPHRPLFFLLRLRHPRKSLSSTVQGKVAIPRASAASRSLQETRPTDPGALHHSNRYWTVSDNSSLELRVCPRGNELVAIRMAGNSGEITGQAHESSKPPFLLVAVPDRSKLSIQNSRLSILIRSDLKKIEKQKECHDKTASACVSQSPLVPGSHRHRVWAGSKMPVRAPFCSRPADCAPE